MPTLSVAIVTHNEQANLPRTLHSVRWAHQIIVVDSHSTDRTPEIARSFGVTLITRDWPGFAEQKNFAIAQCTGDFILSLDADEELTPPLQSEIQTLLASQPLVDAFYLKRRNLFLGRFMRHGGFYPDAKLRLFRRHPLEPALTPSFTPRPVHETISCSGPTLTLTHELIHHAYPTLSAYIQHMDRYSSLGAQLLVERGRTSQSLPAFLANVFIVPWLNFLKNYLLRFGFLDGRQGLLLHLYQATYTSWKYAKAWELAAAGRQTSAS